MEVSAEWAGIKVNMSQGTHSPYCRTGLLAREARVATFGVEPLLAFGIAREIEITNLKILLGGRAVGLKPKQILEELRFGYA